MGQTYFCHLCGKRLDSAIDIIRYISKKPTCKECYIDELGKLFEQHPPGIYKYDTVRNL